MIDSIDKKLMMAIRDALKTITIANNYHFDIGTNVTWGKITNTSDQLPCIFLLDGDATNRDDDDTPNVPGRPRVVNYKIRKRVIIEAHVPCDKDEPNAAGHDALADIKRLMGEGDRSFGTIALSTKWVGDTFGRREDGTAVIPVLAQFDITYTADFAATA